MKSWLILSVMLLYCTLVRAQKNELAVVKTDAGLVSGSTNVTGDVHIFKGIPFAAPPVGNLRWKAPQAVMHWDGVKQCTSFSASPLLGQPDEFGVYTREFLIP